MALEVKARMAAAVGAFISMLDEILRGDARGIKKIVSKRPALGCNTASEWKRLFGEVKTSFLRWRLRLESDEKRSSEG